MRNRNRVRKWKYCILIEWKRYFAVIFFVNYVTCSENVSEVSITTNESVEVVPLSDNDNQDRNKIRGTQYHASLESDRSPFENSKYSADKEDVKRKEKQINYSGNNITQETDSPQNEIEEKDANRSKTRGKKEFQMGYLDTILENYDKRAWPTYGTREPTLILVNMYINSIGSISAADMDYSMDIYLRQSWVDPRLALDVFGIEKPIFLSGENIISRIWEPDLYFRNVKEAKYPSISNPNMMIKIGPHGEVLFSTRLSLKLSCQMSFKNYPLDKQECHVIMGSSSYTVDVVQLGWMKDAILLDHRMEIPDYSLTKVSKDGHEADQLFYQWDEEIPPDDVWDYLEAAPVGFKIISYKRDSMTLYFPTTGTFSYVNATFTIKRQNGYHLVNTYLPISLIVMISWVSFFLNVDASPARTTLGVTTLLALTTVAAGIRRQIPPVSYIKAVDVWIGACSIMVFSALIEFAIVNFLSRSKQKGVNWKQAFNVTQWIRKFEVKIYPLEQIQPEQRETESKNQKDENIKFARKIDRFARFSFPSVFFIFNLIYWFYYLYLVQ